MQALAFWRAVAADTSDLLGSVLSLLAEHRIRYCLIGGQAVNAYVEPVVSLDLDLVVATGQLDTVRTLAKDRFEVREFPHSLNISQPGSRLRVQLQTDPRYAGFPDRATERDVMDLRLPVACLEDVLQGKIWAASDPGRRPSKRQKDLADISRLLEAYPALRPRVPEEILNRLV